MNASTRLIGVTGLLTAAALMLAGHTIRIGLAEAPIPAHPQPWGELVFLGSLLESSGASSHPSNTNQSSPMPDRPRPILTAHERPLPFDREPLLNLVPSTSIPDPRPLPPRLFASEKQLPQAVTTVVVPAQTVSAPVWIRGPARRRELLARPPLAPYLAKVRLTRLRSQDVSSTVELELRFTLTPEGRVDHVEIVRSSGDPLVDLVGLTYLKDWRFAALDLKDSRKHADSWGRVTLRMGLGAAP